MKMKFILLKMLILLIFVTFLVSFSYKRNLDKKINEIEITFFENNNLFINKEKVASLLLNNGAYVDGQRKEDINIYQLENKVKNHALIEDAEASVTVDGVLKVNVKEREPIARVQYHNTSYYIDRLGEEMPLSKLYSARVPLVTGYNLKTVPEELKTVLNYIYNDSFLKKQITGVQQIPKKEFYLYSRKGNHKIVLGTIDSLEQKMKNLKAFYKYSIPKKSFDKYSMLNLKYHNRVVCTKK